MGVTLFFSCEKYSKEKLYLQEVIKEGVCVELKSQIVDFGENDEIEGGFIIQNKSFSKEIQVLPFNYSNHDLKKFQAQSLNINQTYLVYHFDLHSGDTIKQLVDSIETSGINIIDFYSVKAISNSSCQVNVVLKESCSFAPSKVACLSYVSGNVTSAPYYLNPSLSEVDFNENQDTFRFEFSNLITDTTHRFIPVIIYETENSSKEEAVKSEVSIELSTTKLITGLTSEVGGEIVVDVKIERNGTEGIDEVGVVYSSVSNSPNFNGNKVFAAFTDFTGEFTLINLANGVTYYYRAFSKTNNKITYGDVLSFTK